MTIYIIWLRFNEPEYIIDPILILTSDGNAVDEITVDLPLEEHTWVTRRQSSITKALPGKRSHFQKHGPWRTRKTQKGNERRWVQ